MCYNSQEEVNDLANTNPPLRPLLLRIGLRIILIILLFLFIILLLPRLLDLFLPFVLAYIAAAILAPLVGKISGLFGDAPKKMGKAWNFWSMLFVILLIVTVTGVLVYAGYYLFQQISDLVGSWSSLQESYTSILNSISKYLENHATMTSTELEAYIVNALNSVVNWISDKISTWAPNMISGVGNLASTIASFIIALLFFIVGAYFMTSDYHNIHDFVSSHIPNMIRPQMRQLRAATGSAMFGYLKAQLILSGIVALIVFLALTVWGQSYPALIAILCGIIDIIPFFGSGTILVPWAVVELFLGHYNKALFLAILALVLFLFRKIAEPKVVGNQTGLPPLLSLISIYVGMKLGAVIGMILVPVLCMIVLSLYSVGFFDPTIHDFIALIERIRADTKLGEVSTEDVPNQPEAEDRPPN